MPFTVGQLRLYLRDATQYGRAGSAHGLAGGTRGCGADSLARAAHSRLPYAGAPVMVKDELLEAYGIPTAMTAEQELAFAAYLKKQAATEVTLRV